MPTKEQLQDGFRIGDWEVLPGRGILRRGDQEEEPEPKVFELLMTLAQRDGDVATREDIVDEVWDGYPVGDDSITRCVAQLRSHLGDGDKTLIKTLTRRGYRMGQRVQLDGAEVSVRKPMQFAGLLRNQRRLWVLVAAIIVAFVTGYVMDIGGMFGKGRIDSIAVLPFENLSGDEADQYRVSGFKVELVQTLYNLPGITVKHGRVSYPNTEVSEIAEILDVDAVLFGELQRVDDTLKITYRIARGRDGDVIVTDIIEGQVGEEFALQEQVAYQVRSALIGEPAQQLISERRHPNSEAYDRYMRGLFLLERRGRGRPENLDTAIELFEQAIELDPAYGAPYLSLASAYVLMPDYRNASLVEWHQRALEVIERGMEKDDSIRDAAAEVIGFAYHKKRQWAEAEEAYVRATTAEIVDSNAFNWYSLMLAGVGRLDDALEQILIAQRIDPTSVIINTRLGMVYTWLGENEEASEYLDRARQLDASWEMHMLGRAILLAREGQLEEAKNMFDAGVTLAGGTIDWLVPFFEALEDPSNKPVALAAIADAFENPVMDPRVKVIALAVLGETDGAMSVAMTLAHSDVFFEMDFLFTPELQPLREHPGFLVLMKELGVVDYWEANQCIWENDQVRCPS